MNCLKLPVMVSLSSSHSDSVAIGDILSVFISFQFVPNPAAKPFVPTSNFIISNGPSRSSDASRRADQGPNGVSLHFPVQKSTVSNPFGDPFRGRRWFGPAKTVLVMVIMFAWR